MQKNADTLANAIAVSNKKNLMSLTQESHAFCHSKHGTVASYPVRLKTVLNFRPFTVIDK